MSNAEESKSKETPENSAEEQKSTLADQLESEMENRDEGRLEAERTEQEDLNQGMSTGTHDSTRFGVNWGPSFTTGAKAKAATANAGTEEKKDDSESKP